MEETGSQNGLLGQRMASVCDSPPAAAVSVSHSVHGTM